jgi:CyaY protein
MDEFTFQDLASAVFRRIGDALEDEDPDAVDYECTGDVVTLTLRGAQKCVLNTQRAARQIWLAASARAWHFSWDAASGTWLDDRGRGEELFETIARVVEKASGVKVAFSREALS